MRSVPARYPLARRFPPATAPLDYVQLMTSVLIRSANGTVTRQYSYPDGQQEIPGSSTHAAALSADDIWLQFSAVVLP